MDMPVPNTFGLAVKTEKMLLINPETSPCHLPDRLVVVGEGSNILFVTNDIKFPLAKCEHHLFEVTEFDDCYHVHLGAGLNWHQVVMRLLSQGIYGLENLALIPGTVGAAPVQNIGAYGVEFSKFCSAVMGIDLLKKERVTIQAKNCDFAYRDSIFKRRLQHTFVIETVCLRIPKNWQPVINYGPLAVLPADTTAQAVFDLVCETRQKKLPDPKVLGNAGSFFKNPIVNKQQADLLKGKWPNLPTFTILSDNEHVKVAAGYLIDQAGLKGFSINDAAIHKAQALVIVNLGHATFEDVLALAKHVRFCVNEMFGILLEPEVRFFDEYNEINPESIL